MTTDTPTGTYNTQTIWVCVDCMYAHEFPGESDDATGNEWCNYSDILSTDITAGMLWWNDAYCYGHSTEWDYASEGERTDHYENCERREFSHRPCDACGSHLAGSRYAYTVWENA